MDEILCPVLDAVISRMTNASIQRRTKLRGKKDMVADGGLGHKILEEAFGIDGRSGHGDVPSSHRFMNGIPELEV